MTSTPTRPTSPVRPGGTDARRVVEAPDATTEYAVRRLRVPDELPRGVLAGLEGMLGSLLIVAIPAVATYVATVSSPVLGEASWIDAARAGAAAWLLGLGQVLDLGAPVSVVPLGVTLLCLVLLAASVRRARLTSLAGVASAAGAGLAVVVGAYAFADVTPGVRGVVGALAVVAGGIAIGLARSGWPDALRVPGRIPTDVIAGMRLGVRVLVLLGAAGAVVVVAALLGAAGEVREVHDALAPDAVSAVVLVGAQLLVLPTAAVWAVAWLAGPGFTLGPDVSVAPDAVVAGPLPAIPALAALPEPGTAWASAGWVVLVPVLLAAVAAWRATRGRSATWRQQATTAGVALGVVVAAVGLACWAASGVVGPLVAVGPSALLVMPALAVEVAVGVAAGAAAARLLPTGLRWPVSRRPDPAGR
ncbi:conserved hypothetical protein [Beutenbergia cavernae DSM 12333]|uniref:PE-PGRS family protein n=1 Tax=Beutenbergia cavernae (strain ATCC BAA-8 / DSM 12333 / CCUG 43141 / JCM 11478 / NBRC 16432 / NCIMB 13614 / HKI 0122) TaxID=471853 RepID=C5BZT0_BEUC1|nr:DUF6350 family protein [Beutenbergia cavernae]ACQ81260.1 conserved hypothetical protein [Beutenbergia cavernae DSM 12333]